MILKFKLHYPIGREVSDYDISNFFPNADHGSTIIITFWISRLHQVGEIISGSEIFGHRDAI
ncbi:hypothetical protein BJX62DRAFT_219241 [Aspergillus germanicus]